MGTDQSELPEDAVGRRVSCGEERATVRYVGPIPPTIGLWLGVEWDNPERGKHDGSHEGVSYFTCRHPTGGSFIRPGKASFGVDYLAAVRQVYGMDTEEVLSEDVSSSSSKKINSLLSMSVHQWDVVNELDKLPSLVQFWCRGNRLVSSDGNPRTANQMLIAKLGQVVTLNGCEIHHEDRRGAELDYIKMFGEAWLKAGGRSQISSQFTSQHPRYQKLIDKYGAPEEGELKKIEPFALKNQLLKITFVFPEDAGRKPIEKKLPASMLVQKVKGLLYRLLKVPAADLKLTYTSPKMVGTEFEIDSDLKTLQFYSIEDGDQVLVRWS
uniref:Tubulin-specific chaperone E n=1 Tax=Amphiprion ocellaris TaxID=80972 RepID=A0AAQ5Y055_AMPOC